VATLSLTRETRPDARQAVSQLLRALGEDPAREGLRRTPERVARALEFLTSGVRASPADVLNGAIFKESYRGVVLVRDIEFYSLCEHHLLPFHGRAHLAYLPNGRVIGLSKLPRLLDVHARRLQVQERLTDDVARAIDEAIRPRGVAVVIEASHFCMMMRGVEKQESRTVTSAFLGAFERNADLRRDLLATVHGPARALEAVSLAGRSDPLREERRPFGPAPTPAGKPVIAFPERRAGKKRARGPAARRGTDPQRLAPLPRSGRP
jgi:GTP cyclohydrolase I